MKTKILYFALMAAFVMSAVNCTSDDIDAIQNSENSSSKSVMSAKNSTYRDYTPEEQEIIKRNVIGKYNGQYKSEGTADGRTEIIKEGVIIL